LRILAELMNGTSNEAIAATCNVAIQTVRNRLVRLMRDVGVENRTQLATRLVRE
ncbi:MAG: Bacterial regulatory protein luxR family, partial [Actinomycetota bacterium]